MPSLAHFSKVENRIFLLGSFEFFLLPVQRPLLHTSFFLLKVPDAQKILSKYEWSVDWCFSPDTQLIDNELWPLSVNRAWNWNCSFLLIELCISLLLHPPPPFPRKERRNMYSHPVQNVRIIINSNVCLSYVCSFLNYHQPSTHCN